MIQEMKRQRLEESIPKKEKNPGQNLPYTKMYPIGNFKDCDFYIPDEEDRSGIAFRIAYKTAKQSMTNKELCASVGSMMCIMSAGRLRNSVNLALNRIGLQPREVKLPSEAEKFNINLSEVPEMDWPTILVTFACSILHLFQNKSFLNETLYTIYMGDHIRKLQKTVGYDPASLKLDIPFDFQRATTIRSMLGVTRTLRESAMKYILDMATSDEEDSGIGNLCHYVSGMLYWSGYMDEFNKMNEMLVTPQSPVLNDPRVANEVSDLIVAREAVEAHHPHSQYFIHMASDAERSKVDSSRFPTLIAVAKALGGKNDYYELMNVGEKFRRTVEALVKLHRENKAKVT